MLVVKIVRERRNSTFICRRGTSLYWPFGFHYETLLHNLGSTIGAIQLHVVVYLFVGLFLQ